MSEGDKLLARAKNSQSGWRRSDLERLYGSFGFEFEEGRRHRKYFHPKYPALITTVARHPGELPKAYVKTAIGLIEKLKTLEGERTDG